jgi:ATP-dependent helicase HrpB
MVPLPIDRHLPDIVAAARSHRALVLVAPPGAGKTTRVPPALLAAKLLGAEHPNLVMLQPRRVAARASAERIADEQGWTLGGEVGFQVRFERRIGRDTRLRVLTEGILTRQLLDDPFLEGVGCVILDEFHERSIHTDLCAALLREVKQTVREDLILVVMSATLEAEPVSRFLGGCPIVRTEGRTFPVEIRHAGYSNAPAWERAADAVREMVEIAQSQISNLKLEISNLKSPPVDSVGDILVFLPGVEEIRRCGERLSSMADRHDLRILPLHGSLPPEEQALALRPARQRKVVLATNIAETSLTIDGVRTVIDSGLARVASYDPQRGMDRLDLETISKASAAQRAGRAGRTAPGTCLRLWSPSQEQAMADFNTPEIRRVDLCSTILLLHAWGKPDLRTFGWYEPPDEEMLASAERLLAMLGALDAETNGQITPLGRRMIGLPTHPRLARLLLAAAEMRMTREGAAIAALLAEKDIAWEERGVPPWLREVKSIGDSDLLARMEMLAEAERSRFAPHVRDRGIDPVAARQTARARDELLRIAERTGSRTPSPGNPGEGWGEGSRKVVGSDDARSVARSPHPNPLPEYRERGEEDALLRLALLAYPDRVCRRRTSDASTAVMVGGRGVKLAAESVVRRHEFFLALDARQDQRSTKSEALVRIASGIEMQWLEGLFPQSIRRERTLVYDEQRRRVVARGTVSYRDLLLREEKDAPVDAQAAGPVLAAALRPRAREIFEANEDAAGLLDRISLLRRLMPEHPWPTWNDAELGDVLAEACAGKRGMDDLLAGRSLESILSDQLVYPLDRLLAQHAPPAIEVPTGNMIRLQYRRNEAPILAVRLQEIFGWTDTPRIAGGRVPVLLHLLGPNYRPVQITDDLRSFWSGTYFQVRKDLRVRYPKHSWPEDPLTATPEAKGRRRG